MPSQTLFPGSRIQTGGAEKINLSAVLASLLLLPYPVMSKFHLYAEIPEEHRASLTPRPDIPSWSFGVASQSLVAMITSLAC